MFCRSRQALIYASSAAQRRAIAAAHRLYRRFSTKFFDMYEADLTPTAYFPPQIYMQCIILNLVFSASLLLALSVLRTVTLHYCLFIFLNLSSSR